METLNQLYDFVVGQSALSQLIQVVLIAIISYTVLISLKNVVDVVSIYSNATESLLPYLYDGPQVIFQDPNMKDAITILPSVNAPSGLEFSYSCFLLINKSTFQGQAGSTSLKHIFHKGSASYKPLMCPGVFVQSTSNVLVIYMNETSAWNTRCEIPNIPIGKFFHLAIIVRNMNVDVYINGNVAHRMTLKSVPKQNFGDVFVFKNETAGKLGQTPDNPFIVSGAASGLISRLTYSGYALNYEQIDSMVRAGPSTKMVSATQNLPPYLADDWWVTYYTG
jgi:hypothetical protein